MKYYYSTLVLSESMISLLLLFTFWKKYYSAYYSDSVTKSIHLQLLHNTPLFTWLYSSRCLKSYSSFKRHLMHAAAYILHGVSTKGEKRRNYGYVEQNQHFQHG